MPEHVNFYENLKEAQMRLRGTVVLYDKMPYYIQGITNHKSDGVFRAYLQGLTTKMPPYTGFEWGNYGSENPALGPAVDQWMEANPGKYLRKRMNSPLFDKFRPFPLGMANVGGGTYYLERQPVRPKTEQGLTRAMVTETLITLNEGGLRRSTGARVDFFSEAMESCILGQYPTAKECLKQLSDPDVENSSAAFHRNFALLRGPIGMFFLAYKEDVVGALPSGSFDKLILGTGFKHVKEAVEELGLFNDIVYQ